MSTLKEIIFGKYAARFIDESYMGSLLHPYTENEWINTVRRRLPKFDIPLTVKEEIIALFKPMAQEVKNWTADHKGIFTTKQELKLKFCFNADGSVNRIKTADSINLFRIVGWRNAFRASLSVYF
ncbi:hypothetical protein TNCT_657761 [Trichonephila clavata]|uniref:Uncharacterized protein n=1 Tax=Trichonephila clavata TaxID=2740835 RepID=A0A8X6GYR7_TRICU|nr:hypothetical protein TNCT_657761 [Trichonephila clavata]